VAAVVITGQMILVEISAGARHGTEYSMVLNGCVKTINVSSTALILTFFNSPSSSTRTQPPFEPPLTCKTQDTMSTSEGK